MPALLALLALQAGVFEDRESGFSIEVPAGWHLVFAGPEGRVTLRRADEPSAFVNMLAVANENEELAAGRWDAYLEQYRAAMKERLPGFVVRRHAASKEPPSLDLWFGAGEGEEAVESHLRLLALKDRLLTLSGNTARAVWEARKESVEAVVRSAALTTPAKDAGAVWTDPKNGFSIGVPAGHRLRPEQRGNIVLSVFAPDPSTSLNVVVQGPERSYGPVAAKDLRANLEAKLTKAFPDFAFAEFAKVEWNGRPALKTAGQFSQGEIKVSNLQFGVSTDAKSYTLTWSTTRDRFAQERPGFEAALRTFRLK